MVTITAEIPIIYRKELGATLSMKDHVGSIVTSVFHEFVEVSRPNNNRGSIIVKLNKYMINVAIKQCVKNRYLTFLDASGLP